MENISTNLTTSDAISKNLSKLNKNANDPDIWADLLNSVIKGSVWKNKPCPSLVVSEAVIEMYKQKYGANSSELEALFPRKSLSKEGLAFVTETAFPELCEVVHSFVEGNTLKFLDQKEFFRSLRTQKKEVREVIPIIRNRGRGQSSLVESHLIIPWPLYVYMEEEYSNIYSETPLASFFEENGNGAMLNITPAIRDKTLFLEAKKGSSKETLGKLVVFGRNKEPLCVRVPIIYASQYLKRLDEKKKKLFSPSTSSNSSSQKSSATGKKSSSKKEEPQTPGLTWENLLDDLEEDKSKLFDNPFPEKPVNVVPIRGAGMEPSSFRSQGYAKPSQQIVKPQDYEGFDAKDIPFVAGNMARISPRVWEFYQPFGSRSRWEHGYTNPPKSVREERGLEWDSSKEAYYYTFSPLSLERDNPMDCFRVVAVGRVVRLFETVADQQLAYSKGSKKGKPKPICYFVNSAWLEEIMATWELGKKAGKTGKHITI